MSAAVSISISEVASNAALRHPMPAAMYQLLSVNESLPGAMTVLPAIIRLDANVEKRLADVSRGDGPWHERTAKRSLEAGLAAIGFRRVHSSALLITTMEALPIETEVFDYLDFWRYSIAVATVTTSLAYARHVEGREYAYAAGLFHDIGRLILEEDDPAGLSIVRSIQLRGEIPWREVEQSAFGYTALDLSVALARAWRLPAPLVEAISGLSQGSRTGLTGSLREAALAARALNFATSTGRRQELSPEAGSLIDRYFEGPDGLRRRVNALLESATISA
ncbi:MAG: HDOD domain-containing protein [Dehalococcoidia bacterium]|nr:MAG: HDOD domain-containing protein [Dehalococcoidia bacterium]